MIRDSAPRYSQKQDITPTSARRRDRDTNPSAVTGNDFDLDGFKWDLMDKFIDDTTAIAQEQDEHKWQVSAKIEEFERLHMRHKAIGNDSDAASMERRAIVQKVNEKNVDFENFTRETTNKKSALRDEMANLED